MRGFVIQSPIQFTIKFTKIMANIFNQIKMSKPSSNVFDLSHDVKLGLDMGNLVPTMAIECVPGDKFNISCESLIRFAPLVSPVMHRMNVYMHYFFVPNRLIWDNWEKFITNTTDNLGALPAFPKITAGTTGGAVYTELMDYFGIPNPHLVTGGAVANENVSALPFAAYQMIYNEYYRDQNLVNEIDYKLVDGSNQANATALTTMRKRAWEHDYFTSALPTAQAGAPVGIPLGTVELKAGWETEPGFPYFETEGTPGVGGTGAISQSGTTGINTASDPTLNSAYNPNGTLEVASTTITDLRRAFRLQEWLEKAMRSGSRYVESVLAHFGVKSSDARLNRPEYITGTASPVVISEVLNTTGTVDAAQGTQSGHAVSVTSGKYGNYFCEEHGYIIGIMSVMPKTAYQQGIEKHWLKDEPFDYYWPSFAHIGEQEILNREVYAFQNPTYGNATFGYIPRYAEYKFTQNRVAGHLRSQLDFWHMGRIFATQPTLSQQFVECTPDNRIFAVVTTDQHLYCHILHKIRAVRRMPKFGTPTY